MATPPDSTNLVLARLEVKLDQLLSVSGDHEARLRNLESRRWPLPVVGIVCSGVAVLTSLLPWVLR